MKLSRRMLSILTVVVVLALLGGGVWWRLHSSGEGAGEAQAAESAAAAEGVEVDAAASQFSTRIAQPAEGVEAVRDTLWVSVDASGRAEAFRRTTVQSQVDGVVMSIRVRENEAVAAGDPVLQIDTTELALDLAQAESELLNARAEYEALLLQGGGIEELDPEVARQRERVARASSGLNSAEVAVRRARMELERSTVRAPFGGRIADLDVVQGQHVTAGTELMSVVDLHPIKVEAEVLEAELGLLGEGRRATVDFAAFPGEEFVGRIASINPVVDPSKRTGRVTILLDNPGGRIKPGMYAEVSIEARAYPDRVLVPRSAILERGEGRRRTMLFVYEEEGGEGLAKWRYVNPGLENEEMVELLPPSEGPEDGFVEPGEIVLVNGHQYLAHDTRVRLVEDVEAAGGRPGR